MRWTSDWSVDSLHRASGSIARRCSAPQHTRGVSSFEPSDKFLGSRCRFGKVDLGDIDQRQLCQARHMYTTSLYLGRWLTTLHALSKNKHEYLSRSPAVAAKSIDGVMNITRSTEEPLA